MSYIREHGINVLSDGYFWPVSENDFHEFSKYIFNEYQDLLLISNDDKLISIGLVETSFVNLLVQIFHCNYVKNYAKINNFDLTIPDFNEYLQPNWQEIGAQYKKNIFPQFHYKPLFMFSFFKNKNTSNFIGAKKYFANSLSIPLYYGIKKIEQDYILKKIKIFINKFKI